MKQALVIVVAVIVGLSIEVASQAPDFSGTWRLDRKASGMKEPNKG